MTLDTAPTRAPVAMSPRAEQPPSRPARSPTAAWLGRVRAAGRSLLVLQRLGWVAGWMLAILLVAGAIDFVLRTPSALRVALWLVGVATLLGVLRRAVWPAVRFRPPLTEVALRIESSAAGEKAGLRGVLASGLELEGSGSTVGRLAEPVIARARERISTMSAAAVLAPARTMRSLGWLGLATVGVIAVASMEPELTRIGASRLLWPLGGAQWPKRTAVADVTGVKVHPLGTALALRAAVKTSGRVEDTRVAAHYRTITARPGLPDRESPVRRVLLTAQERLVIVGDQRAPVDSADANARQLFERLLEPAGLAPESAARGEGRRDVDADEVTLEYWFETEDDRTPATRLLLVEPPSVRAASARVRLPDYASAMIGRFPELQNGGVIDLGPGTDERAAAPAVLAGSRVSVTIELNKPVPGAGTDARAFAARCLGPDASALLAADPSATLSTEERAWTLSWTIDQPVRLSVRATDSHGITGVEDASYRFESLRDTPPSAVITAPTEDKSVLATAIVELAAEARDDVGLEWLTLERQLARRPEGSEGAAAEAREDRTGFARVEVAAGAGTDTRRLVSTSSLDLTELELKPGDEVWITAAAADIFQLNGVRHEPVRSGVRKLRIMAREELVQQVWSELGAVRRTAVKIDEDQRELRKSVQRAGPEEARRAERAQAAITERITRQRGAIDQLAERIRENALTDQSLSEVLRESDRLLSTAGEQSVKASEALNRAEKAESAENPDEQAAAAEREQAAEAQEQVRDDLGRLIDLLDQGEDTYAARRAIEQILQQQKSLQARTGQAGESTTGKSAEQLTPQEKQDLQKLAQEQNEAAEKLKEAIEKMLQREEKLEKNDPAAAQQMAQAAKRGQREQAEKKMREAAQQVAQNQTNSAQQRQQQAIQSLEQMLKELDKAAQARDEVLRRYLASLIESLRGLIQQQEGRLAELDAAIPDRAFQGLDLPMARLHQATLGVIDEARNAPREAADVLALVDRAADAQAAAVVGLRDDPVNEEEVRSQEQLSLDKLNEALQAAEKLDEDAEEREQDRKRQELRQRYLDALKDQTGIRDSTLGLVGAEPTRRTRATARQLGDDQESLRAAVDGIRAETRELRDARLFDYAHTRLNDLMKAAAEELAGGVATAETARRQAGAARVLASLADALDDKNANERRFRERQQQQGGGGGGSNNQPLVPPAAELKLLKLLQQDAAERTRGTAEAPQPDAAAVVEVTRLQRELADQARELLERLSRQGGGGPGGGGAPPTGEPMGEPEGLKPGPGDPGADPDEPEGNT